MNKLKLIWSILIIIRNINNQEQIRKLMIRSGKISARLPSIIASHLRSKALYPVNFSPNLTNYLSEPKIVDIIPFNKSFVNPLLYCFSSQKDSKNAQNNSKTESPKQQKNQTEKKQVQNDENNKEEKGGNKLSEMSIEELIELNTEESIRLVQKKIETLQKNQKLNAQKIAQLQKKLVFLEKHHNQLTDKEQMLLQNLKTQQKELTLIHKRSQREIEDSKDYAITKLAKQLIETADNIKRCRQYAEKILQQNPDNRQDEYLSKIIMSHKQVSDLLKLYDIEEFDPTGKPFDPNTSESLVTIPCPPGYTVNNVAMAMQTGYKIKNRILRSARVGIFV